MGSLLQEAVDYLHSSRFILLVTTGDNGYPDVRTMGGYNLDEDTVYLATEKKSNKVKEIEKNNKVILFAQNEGQTIPDFQNFTYFGKAVLLEGEEENRAKKLINERKPQLDLSGEDKGVIKVTVEKVKRLDYLNEPEKQIQYEESTAFSKL